MLEYQSIKTLAKSINRPVRDLLALSSGNDPFYAGVGHRGKEAEWYADLWLRYGKSRAHLRRIHYQLVSPPEGVRILLPNGREYQNTENDWLFLCRASLAARYLDLVPFDGLIDRRNDEPMFFAYNTEMDPDSPQQASTYVVGGIRVDTPDLPITPFYVRPNLYPVQSFIVEVWIEKSTQNDWLIPFCERRGVNLVVGIGEQSETRSRELALRSAEYGAPVRILYLSDFDPGGRSMPKAVARKVEFTIAKFDLDTDLQLIPVVLTPDQCRQYNLPRTPIKATETRKDKFERTFGVGATELDALEALHPGEMERLLKSEIDNWLDHDLDSRVYLIRSDASLCLRKIEEEIKSNYTDDLDDLENRFEEIVGALREWEEEAEVTWSKIEADLEVRTPDLSSLQVPESKVSGKTERFVLFDSQRDYFTQLDHYHLWRDGEE